MGEQVRYYIMNTARRLLHRRKRIVFAEGEETKIIRAAAQILDEGIGHTHSGWTGNGSSVEKLHRWGWMMYAHRRP